MKKILHKLFKSLYLKQQLAKVDSELEELEKDFTLTQEEYNAKHEELMARVYEIIDEMNWLDERFFRRTIVLIILFLTLLELSKL